MHKLWPGQIRWGSEAGTRGSSCDRSRSARCRILPGRCQAGYLVSGERQQERCCCNMEQLEHKRGSTGWCESLCKCCLAGGLSHQTFSMSHACGQGGSSDILSLSAALGNQWNYVRWAWPQICQDLASNINGNVPQLSRYAAEGTPSSQAPCVPHRQLSLCRGPRPLPPRPPSLLQKLLAKDIRRDHSHLLQCFRWGASSLSGSIAVQHSRRPLHAVRSTQLRGAARPPSTTCTPQALPAEAATCQLACHCISTNLWMDQLQQSLARCAWQPEQRETNGD